MMFCCKKIACSIRNGNEEVLPRDCCVAVKLLPRPVWDEYVNSSPSPGFYTFGCAYRAFGLVISSFEIEINIQHCLLKMTHFYDFGTLEWFLLVSWDLCCCVNSYEAVRETLKWVCVWLRLKLCVFCLDSYYVCLLLLYEYPINL